MSRILLAVLAVALIGYGLFEARRLIEGPTITITAPKNGSATSTAALSVTGTARNISFLTINDHPAYTDEAGNFAFTLSPPPGYASITVTARDRFGRSARKSVFITVVNFCPLSGIDTIIAYG